MLNVCSKKGIYKELTLCLIGSEEIKITQSDFDIVVCSACMIKGHLPNSCFEVFLSVLKQNSVMVFSIRDIYMNSETDSGMGYHLKLAELENSNVLKKLEHKKYTKYKGLAFGAGYQEESANIFVFEKI